MPEEILDAADFERRINQLTIARTRKTADINRFPKVLAIAGAIGMLILAVISLILVFAREAEEAGAIAFLIAIGIGILVLVASIVFSPFARAVTLFVLAICFFVWPISFVFLIFMPAGLGIYYYYDSIAVVVLVCVFIATILLIYAAARTRRHFGHSRLAGITALAAGIPGGLASAAILIAIIAEMIEGVGRIEFFSAVVAFLVIIFFGCLVVMGFFSILSFSRIPEKGRYYADKVILFASIAFFDTLVSFGVGILASIIGGGRFGLQVALIVIIYMVVFYSPVFIMVAGFVDFYCQKTFRHWSARVDVELSRMEQELALCKKRERLVEN